MPAASPGGAGQARIFDIGHSVRLTRKNPAWYKIACLEVSRVRQPAKRRLRPLPDEVLYLGDAMCVCVY